MDKINKLTKEKDALQKKLSEIKEIIESNDSDLIDSFYRIKIILDD